MRQEQLEGEHDEQARRVESERIDGGVAPVIVRQLGAAVQRVAASDAELSADEQREVAALEARVAEALTGPTIADTG